LASSLFLSVGLACGCHWGPKWRKKSDSGERSTENLEQTQAQPVPPNPLYEDVFIQQEQEPLELKLIILDLFKIYNAIAIIIKHTLTMVICHGHNINIYSLQDLTFKSSSYIIP
jgi:hypothetical protein